MTEFFFYHLKSKEGDNAPKKEGMKENEKTPVRRKDAKIRIQENRCRVALDLNIKI